MLRWLLILLLVFLSVGAFYGGISMLLDPSGRLLQASTDMLQGSPFRNFLVPGIVLLLFNGVIPLVAAVGLILRKPAAPLPWLPLFKTRHWAWTLALASGIILSTWIAVQIAMIGYWSEFPIQAFYGGLGLVIIVLCGLTYHTSVATPWGRTE
jgi:hypothetical protein